MIKMKRIIGTLVTIVAVLMFNIAPAMAQEGLFPICYQSVNQPPIGGYQLDLNLLIDSADTTVTGTADIVNGSIPVDVKSDIKGTYSIIASGPYVVINAKGYPEVKTPPNGELYIPPNAELHLSFDSGFNSDSHAVYEYRSEGTGPYTTVDLPMAPTACFK